mmetsp:Transcript_12433/g.40677  ORF Transcript_12433/g.40677 Transcript_12433/m.40677 type:complete len:317 (+) Transcript_12433:1472-2422(+)
MVEASSSSLSPTTTILAATSESRTRKSATSEPTSRTVSKGFLKYCSAETSRSRLETRSRRRIVARTWRTRWNLCCEESSSRSTRTTSCLSTGGTEMRVVRCHSEVDEFASWVTSFFVSSANLRGARPRRLSSCRNLAASWREWNSTSKPLWLRATRRAAVAVELADVFDRDSSRARKVRSPPVPPWGLLARIWILAPKSPPEDEPIFPGRSLWQSSQRARSSWKVSWHLCWVFGTMPPFWSGVCATKTSNWTRRECGSVHTKRASSTPRDPSLNARPMPSIDWRARFPSKASLTRRNSSASKASDSWLVPSTHRFG